MKEESKYPNYPDYQPNEIYIFEEGQALKLFDGIVGMGSFAFIERSPLYAFKNTAFISDLIKHFEVREEYEKCAYLYMVEWEINGRHYR